MNEAVDTGIVNEFVEYKEFLKRMNCEFKVNDTMYTMFLEWKKNRTASHGNNVVPPSASKTYPSLPHVPWKLVKYGAVVTLDDGTSYRRGHHRWVKIRDQSSKP